MAERFSIRTMKPGEEGEVCALVSRVFDRFVADEFSREGVEEFYRYAEPAAMAERSRGEGWVFVAEEDERLVGMLELRQLEHVAMFFVEDLGRGIGRSLMERALQACSEARPGLKEVTVHASRYAIPVYRRFGFEAQGTERTVRGITYLPMRLRLKPSAPANGENR